MAEEERGPKDDRGQPDEHQTDDNDEGSGRTAPFGWVSLVIIVVLVVGTWFLIQSLSADTKMQDCIQSGRRNCAPIP